MSSPGEPRGLADGEYDVLVVNVDDSVPDEGRRGSDDGPGGDRFGLELVVTAGPAKGETIRLWVETAELGRDGSADALDLLGLPGRMTVAHGRPRLAIDD